MDRSRVPEVVLHDKPLSSSDAPVLATAVRRVDGKPRADGAATALAGWLGLDLEAELETAAAEGRAGEVVDVPFAHSDGPVRRLLLVGTGDASPGSLRTAGAALARRAAGSERLATATLADLAPTDARAHLEGLLLAAYAFGANSRGNGARRPPVGAVDLHLPRGVPAGVRAALALAGVTARSVHLARDLGNTPSNEKDPAWLARRAQDVGRRHGLEVLVRDERDLVREGFGGIAGVGMGSARPPRLIEVRYRPDRTSRAAPHVVLVGKGITFDSGGLSLKPREAMVPMKTDMAAGGAVLAVMAGLRESGVRARVTALVAAAENMPGAGALRPGDVITQYGGRTVEVLNTDAEGRLVLADALAYADAHLDPDLLVDMATLTGAASLGLGRGHGALFTSDDDLADTLLAAGSASGDRLWRMPLVEDLRGALDSPVADLSNISRERPASGGAIVAALFLREFTGARRWAHLDIAGPARADRDGKEVSRGATGFGARLLLRWLEGVR